jgi:hypothetical protein
VGDAGHDNFDDAPLQRRAGQHASHQPICTGMALVPLPLMASCPPSKVCRSC